MEDLFLLYLVAPIESGAGSQQPQWEQLCNSRQVTDNILDAIDLDRRVIERFGSFGARLDSTKEVWARALLLFPL